MPPSSPVIFLDALSTTPVDQRVVEAMAPFWTIAFANPASSHGAGLGAADAVEQARATLARCIGAAAPEEVVFTSGATEANNLAILGAVDAAGQRAGRVLTFATEHSAVLDPVEHLRRRGVAVEVLGVEPSGQPRLEALRAALKAGGVMLVSAMHANNETGFITDVAAIARLCREHGALLHVDASQSAGKIPVDVQALGADLLSLSAHKFHGPKGAGALWVRAGRPRVRLAPRQLGGGHERGLRSGTLNVPAIVGMSRALEIAAEAMPEEGPRVGALRDRLRDAIVGQLDGVEVNGDAARGLPGALSLFFRNAQAQALLNLLPGLAISAGAACSSASPQPSHVLRAMFGDDERALCSLRFGLCRFTTEEEVDRAAALVVEAVRRVRALVPEEAR